MKLNYHMALNDLDVTPDGQVFFEGVKKNQFKTPDGYLKVKHKSKAYLVHRLVAFKYLRKGHTTETVNHIDGNKNNNNINNIEWMTFSENAKHSWLNNLAKPCKGENHGRAVLDDMKVLTIRTLRWSKNGMYGWSHKKLGEKYQVSKETIRNIRIGREWTHLPLTYDTPFR